MDCGSPFVELYSHMVFGLRMKRGKGKKTELFGALFLSPFSHSHRSAHALEGVVNYNWFDTLSTQKSSLHYTECLNSF